jgi:hypothetical protein
MLDIWLKAIGDGEWGVNENDEKCWQMGRRRWKANKLSNCSSKKQHKRNHGSDERSGSGHVGKRIWE